MYLEWPPDPLGAQGTQGSSKLKSSSNLKILLINVYGWVWFTVVKNSHHRWVNLKFGLRDQINQCFRFYPIFTLEKTCCVGRLDTFSITNLIMALMFITVYWKGIDGRLASMICLLVLMMQHAWNIMMSQQRKNTQSSTTGKLWNWGSFESR